MYASGIPIGLVVDHRGPRWATTIGAAALAGGYFLLHLAFVRGPGFLPIAGLSLASFLTGLGSCSAFAGSMKVCTTNWPQHRGTATAFPLGAFGLSAFGYTMLSSLVFKSDTGKFLLFLAVGTFAMVSAGSLFLRILPTSSYDALPTDEPRRPGFARRDSTQLHRAEAKHARQVSKASFQEPSKHSFHITIFKRFPTCHLRYVWKFRDDVLTIWPRRYHRRREHSLTEGRYHRSGTAQQCHILETVDHAGVALRSGVNDHQVGESKNIGQPLLTIIATSAMTPRLYGTTGTILPPTTSSRHASSCMSAFCLSSPFSDASLLVSAPTLW